MGFEFLYFSLHFHEMHVSSLSINVCIYCAYTCIGSSVIVHIMCALSTSATFFSVNKKQ